MLQYQDPCTMMNLFFPAYFSFIPNATFRCTFLSNVNFYKSHSKKKNGRNAMQYIIYKSLKSFYLVKRNNFLLNNLTLFISRRECKSVVII